MDVGGTSASKDGSGSGSHRSTMNSSQIQFLELIFKGCTNPNEQQLNIISEHLGIEPGQIRFWFQNRTQPETQYERAVYKSFILENERLKTENLVLRKTTQDYLWGKLGGKHITINELQSYIQELQSENFRLKKECERLVSQLTGKPLSNENSRAPPTRSPTDATVAGDSSNEMRDSAFHNSNTTKSTASAPSQSEFVPDVEQSAMIKTALAATDKLKVLLSNEHLWVQNNGRYSLDRECYETLFIKPHHFKQNLTGKLESSKDSCDVPINAITLVSMILDSSMLLDLFPTLVTNSETLQIVETGMPGRSASLQLLREVMHTLSPLVAPREFYFLRFCQQVDGDTWIIVDVSHGAWRGNDGNLVPHCHKLLSGCMIQDKHDGHSKVSRVEIVEVNYDSTAMATHSLYSDLVSSGLVFGAERWITTLKRMCERALIANEKPAPGTLLSVEGKRSLMDLSHRMVKEFCATLKMTINEPSATDDHVVRVSTCESSDPHNPGVVFCGTTSLWLPFRPKHVFAFFKDKSWRYKWDFLALGKPVTKIAGVASGRGQPNGISVFKPVIPYQREFAILEETFSDLLGYYVVCAPVDFTAINKAVAGLSTSDTPILSSGFVISADGRGRVSPINLNCTSSNEDSGSLLTVVFQTLFNHHSAHYTNEKHLELVRGMQTLVSKTVKDIKDALIPSSSDTESPPLPSTV